MNLSCECVFDYTNLCHYNLASDKVKALDDGDDCVASQLAFLGPNIWERTLPSSLVDLNIEGFGDLETNVDFSALLDADLPNCPQIDIEAMLAGVEVPAAHLPEKLAVIDSALLQDTNPGVKQNIPGTTGNLLNLAYLVNGNDELPGSSDNSLKLNLP